MARPTDDPKTYRLDLRFPPDLVDEIDEWRRFQKDIPPRAEAIRRLVGKGLICDLLEEIITDQIKIWRLLQQYSKKKEVSWDDIIREFSKISEKVINARGRLDKVNSSQIDYDEESDPDIYETLQLILSFGEDGDEVRPAEEQLEIDRRGGAGWVFNEGKEAGLSDASFQDPPYGLPLARELWLKGYIRGQAERSNLSADEVAKRLREYRERRDTAPASRMDIEPNVPDEADEMEGPKP